MEGEKRQELYINYVQCDMASLGSIESVDLIEVVTYVM